VIRDRGGGPQGPHELDLFLAPRSSVGERLAQSLVLHWVPAHADAQPHPSPAEHIHLSGLLRHQYGLALRQDQHAGHQLDGGRERRDVAEQNEHLVEGIVTGIAPPALSGRGSRAEHMVVNEDVLITELFDLGRPASDVSRIGANLRLRKDRPDSHA
jgi:hypothetical protein